MKLGIPWKTALPAALVLWLTELGFLLKLLGQNAGHLTYVIDDSYIYMAMAKNIALFGVWGVTPYQFSSASSAHLWTVLSAICCKVFGVNELYPFVLNVIFGTGVLLATACILEREKFAFKSQLLILLCMIFLVPLPNLAFLGLEHSMHLLLTMLVIYMAAKDLSAPQGEGKKHNCILIVLTALLAACRYEGLFVVAIVCLLYLLRRRLKMMFLLGIAGAVPIIAYGLFSIAQGAYFLPNSILIKGNTNFADNNAVSFIVFLYERAKPFMASSLLASLVVLIHLVKKHRQWWRTSIIMLACYAPVLLMHMVLARTGWFYRYEAYLVGMAIISLAIGIKDCGKVFLPITALGAAAACNLIRSAFALAMLVPATTNVYQQQYQMGHFIQRFYKDRFIVASDIGCICFFGQNIHLIDLYGLGTTDILLARHKRIYDKNYMQTYVADHKADIAILSGYEGFPDAWVKAGEWDIHNNVQCEGDMVTFYALREGELKELQNSMHSYAADLPQGVDSYVFDDPSKPAPQHAILRSRGKEYNRDIWQILLTYISGRDI
jgi:hypothetical protein